MFRSLSVGASAKIIKVNIKQKTQTRYNYVKAVQLLCMGLNYFNSKSMLPNFAPAIILFLLLERLC